MVDCKRIYLASPFTHEDFVVRLARKKVVTECSARLLSEGQLVFSPIVYGAMLAEGKSPLPVSWDFWEKLDASFLKNWATELWVLKMEGWEKSVGIREEISIAEELNLPVVFLECDL